MTKEVRAQIEELLKDFGGGRNSTQYSVPSTQRAEPGAQYLVPGSQKRHGRAWSRAQRRVWREMMEEAGCQLPFPADRESVHQILSYVLGRLVARRMRPQDAEAVVHVCKLMLRY